MRTTTCPRCDGEGYTFAFGIRYAPGYDGPKANVVVCQCCDGIGVLTQDRVTRMERGERFAEYRKELGLGLRAAAAEWGMKPSELSYIEQGRKVTDWKPPGFID